MRPMALTLALLVLAVPCSAGMICDGGMVSEGDTQMDVLKRCGPPTYRTTPDKIYLRGNTSVRQTTVVDWIYNFGPQRFIYTITFVGGYVTKIEQGDYGY